MSIEKMPVQPTKQDSCENITGGGTYYPDISQVREMCASLLCSVEDEEALRLIWRILEICAEEQEHRHPDRLVSVAREAVHALRAGGGESGAVRP